MERNKMLRTSPVRPWTGLCSLQCSVALSYSSPRAVSSSPPSRCNARCFGKALEYAIYVLKQLSTAFMLFLCVASAMETSACWICRVVYSSQKERF